MIYSAACSFIAGLALGGYVESWIPGNQDARYDYAAKLADARMTQLVRIDQIEKDEARCRRYRSGK